MKYPELLTLRSVSDLHISCDANRCAFLVHIPRETENDYTTQVYVSDFAAVYPLPVFDVASFTWIDANTLTVARPHGKCTCFSCVSCMDGTEESGFELPFAAQIEGFVANQLIISARRPIEEECNLENGYWTILEEFPIWNDTTGYRSKVRQQLFLCSRDGQIRRISPKEMDVRIVSTNSDCLAYAGCTPGVLDSPPNEIHFWDGIDHSLSKDCGTVTHLTLGKNYVFHASQNSEQAAGTAPVLMQISLKTGASERIAAPGMAIGNYIVSDVNRQGNIFCADGDTLYFVATENGTSQIHKLIAGTEAKCLTSAPGCIDQLDIQHGRIVFAGLRNGLCHEVYCLSNGEHRITSLHDGNMLPSHPAVSISCHGIQGWALREETEDKSCPAILFLHDGPQLAFGEVYHLGMQLLAQNGYVVLFANFPGSVGYGDEFAELRGHWGNDDYAALIQFLDAALDICPEIDPNRLAVIGTGYGAYLAATTIGKCNRFAAAICDGVISNCVSMVSTSDHGITFANQQMNACAFSQSEELWHCSPLSSIASIKTPTLLLHGENDRSSHLSQGQMLFTALKVHGVPTRLCVFPVKTIIWPTMGLPLHGIVTTAKSCVG